MISETQCPACKASLRVSEELAGKQAKCPQCGASITVSGRPTSTATLLAKASPDEIVNELSHRGRSAVLVLFDTPETGEYDLPTLAKAKVRVYSTSDMDDTKKLHALGSLGRIAAGIEQARSEVTAIAANAPVFEFKGDPLGMTLSDFKKKHARKTGGIGIMLPWCSSDSPGQTIEALLSEPWHARCGIVHARLDLPAENNPPTVAGVSAEPLIYQFLDGRLFRITAFFDTDSFHIVRKAVAEKHGEPTKESPDPMWFSWENGVSAVHLIRGAIRPKKPSELHYVHNPLFQQMQRRTPNMNDDL